MFSSASERSALLGTSFGMLETAKPLIYLHIPIDHFLQAKFVGYTLLASHAHGSGQVFMVQEKFNPFGQFGGLPGPHHKASYAIDNNLARPAPLGRYDRLRQSHILQDRI